MVIKLLYAVTFKGIAIHAYLLFYDPYYYIVHWTKYTGYDLLFLTYLSIDLLRHVYNVVFVASRISAGIFSASTQCLIDVLQCLTRCLNDI